MCLCTHTSAAGERTRACVRNKNMVYGRRRSRPVETGLQCCVRTACTTRTFHVSCIHEYTSTAEKLGIPRRTVIIKSDVLTAIGMLSTGFVIETYVCPRP